MAGLAKLLGDNLMTKSGEVSTAAALAGKKALALYFSAHWCGPCRGFTPQLAGWYSQNLKSKGLEVVFVSSDRDEKAFKEYFGEMPWLALPFLDRERKEKLSKKFQVQGIPTVVVLDADGTLITKDGRAAISADPTGEELPWKPKTLAEILEGAKLIGAGGAELSANVLSGKVYGIYFSAHWCPPCKGFTPKLAEWYGKHLKAKGMEIVFVSSDRSEEGFREYFGEMPWIALDYGDRKRKEQLSELFGVRGIPSLTIIDKDGSLITTEGRGAVSADPMGEGFPWYPKPVGNLAQGPGKINEAPTVIAFCEACDAATKQAVEEAMSPVAARFMDEAKKGGKGPRVSFMIATDSSDLTGKLRTMLSLSLSSSPPAKVGWRAWMRWLRWQRSAHNADAGSEGVKSPKLILLDIPDNGGFYEGPEGDITVSMVERFVADYMATKLDRKQLQK